jgi:hypothetical protein
MIWFLVMQVLSTLLAWPRLGRQTDQAKDPEILLLRHQLGIPERKRNAPLPVSRAEKLALAILTARLRKINDYPVKSVAEVTRIFQPETVFNWHRELMLRKWMFQRKSSGGRPRTPREIEQLVVRLREKIRIGAMATSKANC